MSVTIFQVDYAIEHMSLRALRYRWLLCRTLVSSIIYCDYSFLPCAHISIYVRRDIVGQVEFWSWQEGHTLRCLHYVENYCGKKIAAREMMLRWFWLLCGLKSLQSKWKRLNLHFTISKNYFKYIPFSTISRLIYSFHSWMIPHSYLSYPGFRLIAADWFQSLFNIELGLAHTVAHTTQFCVLELRHTRPDTATVWLCCLLFFPFKKKRDNTNQ